MANTNARKSSSVSVASTMEAPREEEADRRNCLRTLGIRSADIRAEN